MRARAKTGGRAGQAPAASAVRWSEVGGGNGVDARGWCDGEIPGWFFPFWTGCTFFLVSAEEFARLGEWQNRIPVEEKGERGRKGKGEEEEEGVGAGGRARREGQEGRARRDGAAVHTVTPSSILELHRASIRVPLGLPLPSTLPLPPRHASTTPSTTRTHTPARGPTPGSPQRRSCRAPSAT